MMLLLASLSFKTLLFLRWKLKKENVHDEEAPL